MSFLDAPLYDSLIVNKVEKSSGNQKVSFFLFTLNIVEEGMVSLLTRNFPKGSRLRADSASTKGFLAAAVVRQPDARRPEFHVFRRS
jgi:hypothetical protein